MRVSRCAHPASRTPGVDATSECRGTPEVEEKNKKARIRCGIRASGIQRTAGASFRRGGLPAGSDPRTRDARTPAHPAGRAWPARRRTRTHTSRRGLGRCEGRSGCSRWCPGSIPFRGRTEQGSRAWASCKKTSPFQATGRSVNSLYALRKGPSQNCCSTSTRTATAHDRLTRPPSPGAQAKSMISKKTFLLAPPGTRFQNPPHRSTGHSRRVETT